MGNKSIFLPCRLVTYGSHVVTYRKYYSWPIQFWKLQLFLLSFLIKRESSVINLHSISGGGSYVHFTNKSRSPLVLILPPIKSGLSVVIFSSSNRIALWSLLWYELIAHLYPLLWNQSSSLACLISSDIPLPFFFYFYAFICSRITNSTHNLLGVCLHVSFWSLMRDCK